MTHGSTRKRRSTTCARLLKPYPAERMQSYAVSRAVNSVKNDTPECIEPIGDQSS